MPPPRLIQLVDFDRVQGGSLIPMLVGVLRSASSAGWRAEVALFDSARQAAWIRAFADAGIEVHFAPRGARDSDRLLTAWMRELLGPADEPVVAHSHFHGFDVAAVLAARGRRRTAIVWHIHSVYPWSPLKVAAAVAKFVTLGRRVDAIFCAAPNICAETARRMAPRSRIAFVPSAVEASHFPLASADERRRARVELDLPEGAVVLVHFGWHWHLKGGDIFLHTVRDLVDRGRDVIAIERGGGEAYSRYADGLGIGDRLRVTPPVDDVRSLHAAADVMLSSSRTEGMAYAVVEALSTGTPVVATKIPGHAFLADHIDNCRLSGSKPAELAEVTIEVLDRDPAEVKAGADAAHRWIVENLSIEVVARALIERYQALLEARGVPFDASSGNAAATSAGSSSRQTR